MKVTSSKLHQHRAAARDLVGRHEIKNEYRWDSQPEFFLIQGFVGSKKEEVCRGSSHPSPELVF